ncbi:hypothetical protein M9Y10_042090 [Tritrichomonas musculus]|uniref:Uncharacterized protein n=1 Tax=Tritrichomonas musculus TaxID=1915356 RepID=A0ABR2K9C2_9EUKA
MIEPRPNINYPIKSNSNEQATTIHNGNDKVVFKLLPFFGFNDNIQYLKLPERYPTLDSEENYVNDQLLTNEKYKIENLQNNVNIEDKSTLNFNDNECFEEDTNFCDEIMIPNANDIKEEVSCSDDTNETLSTKPYRKSKIRLNEQALTFKENFYQLFTFKKKFQKRYVVQIHNLICRQLGLRKVNREESRSIDKYFQHFAPYSDKILKCIKSMPASIWPNIMPSLFKFYKNNRTNVVK